MKLSKTEQLRPEIKKTYLKKLFHLFVAACIGNFHVSLELLYLLLHTVKVNFIQNINTAKLSIIFVTCNIKSFIVNIILYTS